MAGDPKGGSYLFQRMAKLRGPYQPSRGSLEFIRATARDLGALSGATPAKVMAAKDVITFDGMSREAAAQSAGMDRQTLRDWVIRYNEQGLEGLQDRWGDGHPGACSHSGTTQKLSARFPTTIASHSFSWSMSETVFTLG